MTPSPAPMLARSTSSVNNALRDVVVLVCAASAGVHAALVPEHLAEGGPLLGGAFAASAIALAVVAVLARRPRGDERAVLLAVVVLVANAVAYLLSRTTGLPLLIPDPEEVDLSGVATTLAEVLGAVAGVLLLTRKEQS